MHLFRTPLKRGLLLPLQLYFQPITVVAATSGPSYGIYPKWLALQLYLISLVWIPLGLLLGWAIFGISGPTPLWGPPVLAACLVGLGVAVGTMHLFRNNRWIGHTFDYPTAIAIGVVFALTIIFNSFVLNSIAVRTHRSVAQVVDSPILDLPNMFIMGAGMGMALNIFFATRFDLRKIVGLSLGFGSLILVLFATGPNPAVRMSNLAFGITAISVMSHLVFQPLYISIDLLSIALLRSNAAQASALWRISPANWSEWSYVPLPGLLTLIETLYSTNSSAGQQAIQRLQQHPFYSAAARALSQRLEADYKP